MKEISLTQGKVALVDDDDYAAINQYVWHARKDKKANSFYAARNSECDGDGKRKTIRMHRFLLGALPGEQVDHKNGDGLDNQRRNLRFCSNTQNQRAFRTKRKNCSSLYFGVCWDREAELWLAQIWSQNAKQFIGRFSDEQAAARAYDTAALERDPQFRHLNFP